jgi:hypothetical protein
MQEVPLDEYWANQHRRLFSGQTHPKNPFASVSWKVVVLVGEMPKESPSICNIFVNLAKEYGSKHIVGKNRSDMIANKNVFIDEISCEALGRVSAELLDPTDGHIFSESLDWALIYNPPDSLYILGGAVTLIDKFLAYVGREKLEREFLEFASAWSKTEHSAKYISDLLLLTGSSPHE